MKDDFAISGQKFMFLSVSDLIFRYLICAPNMCMEHHISWYVLNFCSKKQKEEVDAHYMLKPRPLLQAGLCMYVSP